MCFQYEQALIPDPPLKWPAEPTVVERTEWLCWLDWRHVTAREFGPQASAQAASTAHSALSSANVGDTVSLTSRALRVFLGPVTAGRLSLASLGFRVKLLINLCRPRPCRLPSKVGAIAAIWAAL